MTISDEDAETGTCREWQPKSGKVTRLYEDDDIILEKVEGGKYRVTFFKEDNHWGGDITFSKSEGVIYDSNNNH